MRFGKFTKSLFDALFRDKSGKVVIIQYPNAPITGWLVFTLLSKLSSESKDSNNLELIGTLFLFTWAYLELVQGVNYFRRFLGFVVILLIAIPVIFMSV